MDSRADWNLDDLGLELDDFAQFDDSPDLWMELDSDGNCREIRIDSLRIEL